MDNRLKHALGDRPNSEFVIDPKGETYQPPLAYAPVYEKMWGLK